MKGADIVICRVVNNQVDISDRYAEDVGIPTLDTDIGGTNDLYDKWGYEDAARGFTVCGFSRNITVTDSRDHSLPNEDIKIIFAYHPTDDTLLYHGPTRSPEKSINFLIRECQSGTYYNKTTGFCTNCPSGSYSR